MRSANSDLEIITELGYCWRLGNICFLFKDVNKPRMNVEIDYFSLLSKCALN